MLTETTAFIKLIWFARNRERRPLYVSISNELRSKIEPTLLEIIRRLVALKAYDPETVHAALGIIPFSAWVSRNGPTVSRVLQELLNGKKTRKETNELLVHAYEAELNVTLAPPPLMGRPPDDERLVWSIVVELLIERGLAALMKEIDESPPVDVGREAREALERSFRTGRRRGFREENTKHDRALVS